MRDPALLLQKFPKDSENDSYEMIDTEVNITLDAVS